MFLKLTHKINFFFKEGLSKVISVDENFGKYVFSIIYLPTYAFQLQINCLLQIEWSKIFSLKCWIMIWDWKYEKDLIL